VSQTSDLLAAMELVGDLSELADRLSAAQEAFDLDAIGALCEQNRQLRPRLAEAIAALQGFVPQTAEEQELVGLAGILIRNVRAGDRSFALWQENMDSSGRALQALCNAVPLCATPTVELLDGCFEGLPAIVVAAGPSLDRNLDLLKGLGDRAVLLSMNRCASVLQAEGIRPHFLVAYDCGEVIPDVHLAGIGAEILDNFVLRPSVHPRMLELPFGRRFLFTDGSVHEAGLLEAMGQPSRPLGGGSVAHTCFQLAFHMGCDPVVVIGQDLAYSDARAYSSRDLDSDQRLHVSDDQAVGEFRSGDGTLSMIGGGYGFRLQRVPGWGGGEVLTNPTMLRFIEHYEALLPQLCADGARTFLNATEGGAHIVGMQDVPLREVIERYMTAPIEGLSARICELHRAHVPKVSAAAMADEIRELEQQMKELDALIGACSLLLREGVVGEQEFAEIERLGSGIEAGVAQCGYFLRAVYDGAFRMQGGSGERVQIDEQELNALRVAVQMLLPICSEAVRGLDAFQPTSAELT
jgi:hypothetical protein